MAPRSSAPVTIARCSARTSRGRLAERTRIARSSSLAVRTAYGSSTPSRPPRHGRPNRTAGSWDYQPAHSLDGGSAESATRRAREPRTSKTADEVMVAGSGHLASGVDNSRHFVIRVSAGRLRPTVVPRCSALKGAALSCLSRHPGNDEGNQGTASMSCRMWRHQLGVAMPAKRKKYDAELREGAVQSSRRPGSRSLRWPAIWE